MDFDEDTEPARPDTAEEEPQQPEPARAPLSAEPGMPDRFRDTVRPLDDLDAKPVVDHAETYDAVHRDLRAVLDDVDQSG